MYAMAKEALFERAVYQPHHQTEMNRIDLDRHINDRDKEQPYG
jgi:hypothetical protein